MRKYRHDVEAGERGYLMSIDCGLGKVESEDTFDQDNGKKDGRAQDGEQTCKPQRLPRSLDEREEKDDGEQCACRLKPGAQEPQVVILLRDADHLGHGGVGRKLCQTDAEANTKVYA